MAFTIMATCSECRTYFPLDVDFGSKEIVCPGCGHAQTNFTEGDVDEMRRVIMSQRKYAIVTLVVFGVGAVAFSAWAACSSVKEYQGDTMIETGLPILYVACALATLVCGYFASAKRFICEF